MQRKSLNDKRMFILSFQKEEHSLPFFLFVFNFFKFEYCKISNSNCKICANRKLLQNISVSLLIVQGVPINHFADYSKSASKLF